LCLDITEQNGTTRGPYCGEPHNLSIDPYVEFEGSFVRDPSTFPVTVLLIKANGQVKKITPSPSINTGRFIVAGVDPRELQIQYEESDGTLRKCELAKPTYLLIECA
jgi:hypothetical protein